MESISKKINSMESPWSDLPEDILISILLLLTNSKRDSFTFSGVCKSWRAVAITASQRYMSSESRQPLLIHYHAGSFQIQSITKPYFLLTKTDLGLCFKRCIGFSFGYMIMVDQSSEHASLSLLDPLSSHAIILHNLPPNTPHANQAVLSFSPESPDCVVLCWGGSSHTNLSYYMLGSERCWKEARWPYGRTQSTTFHDKKLFVLTESGVVIMDLILHPARMLYVALPLFDLHYSWMLVKVGCEVWILQLHNSQVLRKTFSLNFETQKWNRLEGKGGYRFLDYLASLGGRSNCLYFTTQDRETAKLWRLSYKDKKMNLWVQCMSKAHWDTGYGLV